ncbi:MAG: TRAP transporter small permease subunit [Variovorax sp.]
MHPGHALLRSLCAAIFRVCVWITNALLVALVTNNLLEMAARGIWHVSLDWVFEVNLLLAVWLYFLGIYQVYFRRGDISVDVLVIRLPPRVQRWLAIVIDAVIVGTLLLISWHAVELMRVQWPFKTAGLHLPNALFTLPVVMGGVCMALTMLDRMITRLATAEHLPSGIAGMEG